MKITARGIVACVSLLVILAQASIATPSLAQAPRVSLKDELAGHWQLVSVTLHGTAPYGANPLGSMFIDSGGHFSVIVISAGDARSISYFGTYTVDDADKSVTMHVDGSTGGSGVNAAGRNLKRLVTLSGEELIVANDTPSGPGALKLTWKKAN